MQIKEPVKKLKFSNLNTNQVAQALFSTISDTSTGMSLKLMMIEITHNLLATVKKGYWQTTDGFEQRWMEQYNVKGRYIEYLENARCRLKVNYGIESEYI